MKIRSIICGVLIGCMIPTQIAAFDVKNLLDGVKNHFFQKACDPVFYGAYTISMGISAVAMFFSYRNLIFDHGKPASKKVELFVRQSLKEAGFTQKEIRAIEVRESKGFYSFRNIIFVPITKESLERAEQYYAIGDDSDLESDPIEKKEIEEMRQKLSMRLKNVSYKDVRTYRQFVGAATKDAIPFWKGVLIHEMSHVVHHDSEQGMIFKLGFVPPIFAYCTAVFNKAFLMPDFHWLDSDCLKFYAGAYAVIGHLASLPLGKHAERRSDQEMIDRAPDPELLRAAAQAFAVDAKFKNINGFLSRFMHELADVHPNSERRAQYLKEACRALEKKQNLLLDKPF